MASPFVEKPLLEGGNRDRMGVELGERRTEAVEIGDIGNDDEIRVSAKLRPAVQHAGLAAHQERPHAIPLDRRKDSENRARGQANLPASGMPPTAYCSPRAVAAASARTKPPIPRHRDGCRRSPKVVRCWWPYPSHRVHPNDPWLDEPTHSLARNQPRLHRPPSLHRPRCHRRLLRLMRPTAISRHLPDRLGETHGAGGGGVSFCVPLGVVATSG